MPRSDVRPVTVLLVEDDAVTRELTAHVLTAGGFAVEAVPTGERALLALRAERAADWLVTKVDLPGLACGRIVADEYRTRRPDRPAILTSDRLAASGASVSGAVAARERTPHEVLDVLRALAAMESRADVLAADAAARAA